MSVTVNTKTTAFSELIKGAGVLLDSFDPTAPAIVDANILFATSGGINASAVATYSDWAESIDNAAKNMLEYKQLDMWECKISGTAASITPKGAKLLAGAADETNGAVALRNTLKTADFTDLWFIVPKTAENTIVAIKLSNALSTGGLNIQSTDKSKGAFSFEFTGHYSSAAQDTPPFGYYEIVVTPTQG